MSLFQEGVHFYFDGNGRMVLTAKYLLERGYCCQNGCRHCPYSEKQPTSKEASGSAETNKQVSK